MFIGTATVAVVRRELGGKPVFGTFPQNRTPRRTSKAGCSVVPGTAGRVGAAFFAGRNEGERICDRTFPEYELATAHSIPDDCETCGVGNDPSPLRQHANESKQRGTQAVGTDAGESLDRTFGTGDEGSLCVGIR